MVKVTNRNVILISIHPEYANAMFAGEKNIEFRKTNIPNDLEYVILYATSPIKQIVGYFKVHKIIKEQPQKLWEAFSKTSGTTEEFYFRYYHNIEYGLGLILERVCQFSKPFSLENAGFSPKPPQSFSYVDNATWKKIKKRKIIVNKSFNTDSLKLAG